MMNLANMRQLIVPAYIFLCIIFGGSSQAIWGNLLLRLIALVLIGWAAAQRRAKRHDDRSFAMLGYIAIAALILVLFQLIPIPPSLWTSIPARELIARGYSSLGENRPWLPISLAPARTLACGLFLLPPLAVIIGTLVLDAYRLSWAIASILAATILSIALGYLQVSNKAPDLYLYDFTNVGSAVGFFANRNHMGTLLLVTIPFVAWLLSSQESLDRRKTFPSWVAGISIGVLDIVGIAMNGSLAAILLAFPVIAASTLLFRRAESFRRVGLGVTTFAFVVMVAFVANSPVQGKLNGTETSSITRRQQIWSTSLKAGAAAFPLGTGFGSFDEIYPLYEDQADVTGTFINHAHDEFIELFVEGGVPALLLLGTFLFWWGIQASKAWAKGGSMIAQAATIASFTMLAHSVVDYPLRTTALATIFGFCLALMAGREVQSTEVEERFARDLRPVRHVVVA